jgi:hypothetical protein
MSVEEIRAVNLVLLEKVVARAEPAQLTTEVFTKFVPFTARVKPAPPAVALFGESEVMVGFGLLIVNVSAEEAPPPGAGLVTVTGTVPALATSAAGTDAVTCALFLNVVVRGEPFQLILVPFTKPVPFTVSVKVELPAILLLGESDVREGTGLLMVKTRGLVVPPPGAGFETVTLAVPAVAMSLDKIAAVTWPEFTKVVVRLDPFHHTVEVGTKLPPFTVSVKPEPPAVAVDGFNEAPDGTGLSISNGELFEMPPWFVGFNTST